MELSGSSRFFRKFNYILFMCYATFFVSQLYLPAFALTKEDTSNVITLMEKSADLKKSCTGIDDDYQLIIARFKNMMDSSLYCKIDSLGKSCFNPDSTKNEMIKAYLQSYDRQKEQKILQWYKTPLSSKVNELIERKLEKNDYEIINQQVRSSKHHTDSLFAKRFNLLVSSASFKMAVQLMFSVNDSLEKYVYLNINPVLGKQFQFSAQEMADYFKKKHQVPIDLILNYATYIECYELQKLDDKEFEEYIGNNDSPEWTWFNKIQAESLCKIALSQIDKYKSQFTTNFYKGGK